MSRVLTWFRTEVTGSDVITYIWVSALLKIPIAIGSHAVLRLFGVELSNENAGEISTLSLLDAAFIIPCAAFIEEVLFRLPLSIPWYFGQPLLSLPFAVFLSGFFGWVHGDLSNIAVQGLGGLVMSIVFLKCGGLQGKIIKPLLASTSTHALFNAHLYLSTVLIPPLVH